jgi:hypothetical protein
MFPIDLRALQELASRAVGFLAVALDDASEDSQRGYLLEAMNALDDIEATIDTALEISMERRAVEPVGLPLGMLGGEVSGEQASLVA